MADQTTDPLSEAVDKLAQKLYEDTKAVDIGPWPPPPGKSSGTDYAEAFRDRARRYLADLDLATYYEDKGAEKEHAEVVRLREHFADRSPSELKNRNAALLLKVEELTAQLAAAEEKGRSEERERLREGPADALIVDLIYGECPDCGLVNPERPAADCGLCHRRARLIQNLRASLDSDQEGY